MIDLESKRKKIENITKFVGVLVVGFLVYPFIFMSVAGLAGLVVAGIFVALAVTFLPWFAAKLANWKLKALKAEASKNPIETLENQYSEREQNLELFLENIKEFIAEVQGFYQEFSVHKEKYPNDCAQFEGQYAKMTKLLEIRQKKYLQAKANLERFGELIERKRSEWKIALAAAKMSKAAGAGDDFISKLMADTAVSSVQSSLNTAFADLETSLLEESSEAPVEARATDMREAPAKSKLLAEPQIAPEFLTQETRTPEYVAR